MAHPSFYYRMKQVAAIVLRSLEQHLATLKLNSQNAQRLKPPVGGVGSENDVISKQNLFHHQIGLISYFNDSEVAAMASAEMVPMISGKAVGRTYSQFREDKQMQLLLGNSRKNVPNY